MNYLDVLFSTFLCPNQYAYQQITLMELSCMYLRK